MKDDIIKVKIKELSYYNKLPVEYKNSTRKDIIEEGGFWYTLFKYVKFFLGLTIIGYDWEKLEKSLKKEGYRPDKYGPIEVHKKKKEGKFRVLNGNHRVFLLHKLLGDEEEIEVRVNGGFLSMLIRNIYESQTKKDKKPKTTTKEKIKKILVYCKLAVPTLYMFGLHFTETVLLFIALVLVQNVLKGPHELKKFDTLSSKWLDVIWRNIYYNQKNIISFLLLIIYLLHLIIGNFIGFISMIIIYFLIERVIKKLHNKR